MNQLKFQDSPQTQEVIRAGIKNAEKLRKIEETQRLTDSYRTENGEKIEMGDENKDSTLFPRFYSFSSRPDLVRASMETTSHTCGQGYFGMTTDVNGDQSCTGKSR